MTKYLYFRFIPFFIFIFYNFYVFYNLFVVLEKMNKLINLPIKEVGINYIEKLNEYQIVINSYKILIPLFLIIILILIIDELVILHIKSGGTFNVKRNIDKN